MWFRNKGSRIEDELVRSRPVPSTHLLKSIARRVSPRPVVRTRARLGYAGVLTAAMLAVLGATGGFSYAASSIAGAASGVAHAASAVINTTTPPPKTPSLPQSSTPGSAACAQYLNPPTITGSLDPSAGKKGTSVTITGTNFMNPSHSTPATKVSFDGVSTNAVVHSATQLKASVPAVTHSGPISVVVTNCNSSSPPASFISWLTPSGISFSGNAKAGAGVVINGLHFTGVDASGGFVKFNGKSASYAVISDQEIDATVPSDVTGSGVISVTVHNAAGTGTGRFGLITVPKVNSFSPASGAAGSTLTINGKGFTGATFKVGGQSATILGTPVPTDTKVSVTVPTPGGTNPGVVAVSNSAGSADSGTKTFRTIVNPTISGVSTDTGPNVGAVGETVTINGTGFFGKLTVTFGGGKKGTVKVNTTGTPGTVITTKVPANASNGVITVDNEASGSATSASFTVILKPHVDGTATTYSGHANDTITITGSNLFYVTSVKFAGAPAVSVAPDNDTSFTVTVPATARTGNFTVSSVAGASNGVRFTLLH
jgi:hypothetical protein